MCFLQIQEEDLFELADLILNNKEKINARKRDTTWFSVKSVKITFIVFKCHRPIDNSSDFTCLFCREKACDNKKFIHET